MNSETHENRLKRVTMRSMRRGIKEMDIILGNFARDHLDGMNGDELDLYEALLGENDQDLYQWVTGQHPPPPEFLQLIMTIARHAGASGQAQA